MDEAARALGAPSLRDEFSRAIKELLAKRVGYRCSNPGCRQLTSGPHEDPNRAINVGVASHITAASPGGPRYESALTPERRRAVENGIWLCQTCGKLVDSDEERYSVASLNGWKRIAESMARGEIEQRQDLTADATQTFRKAEQLMPELLMEMRSDLASHPLSREFVVLKKSWAYWAKGNELVYYYDDHPELDNKLRILENLGLVEEITYNNTKRFIFTEKLADYLMATRVPEDLSPGRAVHK